MQVLRLGTRGSRLALWQAGYVADQLREYFPDLQVTIEVIRTTGDKILDVALSKIGDRGLFTKEIDQALLNDEIDFAVHSMKDVPGELPAELCIAAVLEREAAHDVLIARQAQCLSELPRGARLGTSSLRRMAQLRAYRADFQLLEIRGNVETRLRRMEEMELDGVLLAAAGIKRLGLEHRISEYIAFEVMLPAVGQGAIGVEARSDDLATLEILSILNHGESSNCVKMERAFLAALGGGCQVPIAALAHPTEDHLVMEGLISSLDGQRIFRDRMLCSVTDAEYGGQTLAQLLLAQGGAQILHELKH